MAIFATSISRPVGDFFFPAAGIILYRPLLKETKSTYRFEKESHVRERNLDSFLDRFWTKRTHATETVRTEKANSPEIFGIRTERANFFQIFGDTLFAVQRSRLHNTQYATPERGSVLTLILRPSRRAHSTETFYSTET